jgi:hypothetical protein
MDKKLVMLGMVIGSTIGGFVPTLFGVDSFSFITLFGTLIGGVLGIWAAMRLSE